MIAYHAKTANFWIKIQANVLLIALINIMNKQVKIFLKKKHKQITLNKNNKKQILAKNVI
jgi:hypothetical protein